MAGLVTSFPALVVSQALWGLGWAFASGADVAWMTDELDRPDLIDRLLVARARWELIGAAPGLLGFGLLATLTDLRTAVVASGLAMAGLGVGWSRSRFPERHFTPAVAERRWHEAMTIFRRGVDLARRDRDMLLVLAAWLLVNGSAEGYGRLFEKRLVLLGFGGTARPIVRFTALRAGLVRGRGGRAPCGRVAASRAKGWRSAPTCGAARPAWPGRSCSRRRPTPAGRSPVRWWSGASSDR